MAIKATVILAMFALAAVMLVSTYRSIAQSAPVKCWNEASKILETPDGNVYVTESDRYCNR
jgi:hypothetical protein